MLDVIFDSNSRSGWPWIEENQLLPEKKSDGSEWPKITIVTPSYNQGQFIEETIRSIILQNYPNLEYIIIDGGSTDNTLEIIKKYESWISYWVSEPDKGQSDAINKGFRIASGIYGNWINSDDLLEKDALWTLAQKMDLQKGNVVYLGDYKEIDLTGAFKRISRSDITNLEELVDIKGHWRNGKSNQIGQQATFFPVSLFREVGMLNPDNHYSMDYELWGRFLIAGAQFCSVHNTLGAFRVYEGQKISDRHKTTKSLINTAYKLISDCPYWEGSKKKYHWREVLIYSLKYYYGYLRSIIGVRRRIKFLIQKIGNKSEFQT